MFVRPTGFSDSFTAGNVQALAVQQEEAYKKAKLAEQSETTLSVIDALAFFAVKSAKEDHAFLMKLRSICESIFESMENVPADVTPERLRSNVGVAVKETIKEMQSKARSVDDEDLMDKLLNRIPSLLQQEVNQLFPKFLRERTPQDELTFDQFFEIRKNDKIRKAKEEALTAIEKLLLQDKTPVWNRKVLICVDLGDIDKFSPRGLEETWVADLINDLKKVSIQANTINEVFYNSDCPAHINDAYLKGSGLPKTVVAFATDSLHKKKSSERSCSRIDELWNNAMEGARGVRQKIIPVRLGSHQTFWPKGHFYHNDFQEDLLTEFPVARKGYHTVLFEIIKSFFKEEYLQAYLEIVKKFKEMT